MLVSEDRNLYLMDVHGARQDACFFFLHVAIYQESSRKPGQHHRNLNGEFLKEAVIP